MNPWEYSMLCIKCQSIQQALTEISEVEPSITNGAMCITNGNSHIADGTEMNIDYVSLSGTKRKSDISISILNKKQKL